jgi:hypothetical protein
MFVITFLHDAIPSIILVQGFTSQKAEPFHGLVRLQQVKTYSLHIIDTPLYLSEYCTAMAVSPTGVPKIVEQDSLGKTENH